MQVIIVLAALVAVAVAAPVGEYNGSDDNAVVILNEYPSDNIGLDGYKFAYELSDGSRREESAHVEARGADEEAVLRVRGSYSFVGADGEVYSVTYVADENGFQPQGAHLPLAPLA